MHTGKRARVDRHDKQQKNIWRWGIGIVCGLLFVVSLLPVFSRVWHIGVYVPMAVGAAGVACCVWTDGFLSILQKIWKRKGLRVILLGILLLIAALLCLFIFVSVVMLRAAARPAPDEATVLVLGAAVYEDRPCRMLADRLDATARYLEANPSSVCVVSGGQGPDEDYAEATVMKAYLIEKGIDESRIFTEDQSTSTYENITFSKQVMEENDLPSTLVIATQEFHQYRAQAFAKRAGFREVGPCTCRTPPHLLLCYWVREFAAICHMVMFGT